MTTPSNAEVQSLVDEVPAGAIVVGVAGRAEDDNTLRWAADRARATGAPVHLLSTLDFDAPLIGPTDFVPVEDLQRALSVDVNRILREAAATVAEREPGIAVTQQSATGSAARALLAASARAREVVLGSARVGRLERILLGSTSTGVVGLAACPVVVVGGSLPDQGDVVVGFDGSAPAQAALSYAAELAETVGAGVRTVTVWNLEVVDGVVATTPGSPQYDQVLRRYQERVDEALAPVRERHTGVSFTTTIRQGGAARVVAEEAASARLLVIGSRGRGGVVGMLFGSVSRKLLNSVTVPVAVLNRPQH